MDKKLLPYCKGTNILITLGSVFEKTTNYSVKGAFWNRSVFVPGGRDLKGGGGNSGTQDQEASIQAKKNKNFIPTEAMIT